jgi:hypothetical protein
MDGFSLTILEREKEKVSRMASDMAHLYLNNIRLINAFTVEERELSDSYISAFKYGKLQFSDAMRKLQDQYNSLYKTYIDLQMGTAKLYAIAERKKQQNSALNITLKQVGFVSGSLQIIGGYGICKASLGAACGFLGNPLMVHGAENTWENGYYLLYREDPTSMPLRSAYRQAAKALGGDVQDGDIAYSIGDLSLSAGSLFRSVLKTDTWKLFRYIRDDYIIGWRDMGAAGLISELVGDSAVGLSLYQLMSGDSTNWNDLSEKK